MNKHFGGFWWINKRTGRSEPPLAPKNKRKNKAAFGSGTETFQTMMMMMMIINIILIPN